MTEYYFRRLQKKNEERVVYTTNHLHSSPCIPLSSLSNVPRQRPRRRVRLSEHPHGHESHSAKGGRAACVHDHAMFRRHRGLVPLAHCCAVGWSMDSFSSIPRLPLLLLLSPLPGPDIESTSVEPMPSYRFPVRQPLSVHLGRDDVQVVYHRTSTPLLDLFGACSCGVRQCCQAKEIRLRCELFQTCLVRRKGWTPSQKVEHVPKVRRIPIDEDDVLSAADVFLHERTEEGVLTAECVL